MVNVYFVRTGVGGIIGRYRAVEGRYERATRVVVRSSMGLQIGQVLAPARPGRRSGLEAGEAGLVLRKATAEDEWLAAQLELRRQAALHDCRKALSEEGSHACLLDVECSLDGQRLCFYFLGPGPSESSPWVDRLATLYGEGIQIERFAQVLQEGCGPDCGTDSAGACRLTGCQTCVLASACAK